MKSLNQQEARGVLTELDDLIVAFLNAKGYEGKLTIAYMSVMKCKDDGDKEDNAQAGITRFVYGGCDDDENGQIKPDEYQMQATVKGIAKIGLHMNAHVFIDTIGDELEEMKKNGKI